MRQSEVMPTLRKFRQHSLWNYEVSKWSPEQIKEFRFMETGKREHKKRNDRNKKVIRKSDGKSYKSIKECATDNFCHPLTVKRHPELYEVN